LRAANDSARGRARIEATRRLGLAFARALGFVALALPCVEWDLSMDQLIADIVAKAGVSAAVARKSLAIIVAFIAREAPPDKVAAVIDKLPGARDLAKESTARSNGLMGVFNDLTAAGLGMTGVQTVARTFVAHARAKAGDKDVDALVRSIPGLSQFV
jgi:hypothetical protein